MPAWRSALEKAADLEGPGARRVRGDANIGACALRQGADAPLTLRQRHDTGRLRSGRVVGDKRKQQNPTRAKAEGVLQKSGL